MTAAGLLNVESITQAQKCFQLPKRKKLELGEGENENKWERPFQEQFKWFNETEKNRWKDEYKS